MAITSDAQRTRPLRRRDDEAVAALARPFHRAGHPPFDTPPASHSAFSIAMMSRAERVAEELAQRLLVLRDAVALDQCDEVARRVARQRRAAEIGIARQEFAGPALRLVKLQRPPPEMRIFSPSFAIVIDQQHAPAALAGAAPRTSCPRRRRR